MEETQCYPIPLPPKGSENIYGMWGDFNGAMLILFHKKQITTAWYFYPNAGQDTINAFVDEAEKLDGSTGKLFATTLRKHTDSIQVKQASDLRQLPDWAVDVIRKQDTGEKSIEKYKEKMIGQ